MKKLAFAFAAAAISAAPLFADINDNIHRSFNVRPGGRLVVDIDEGDIDVRSGAGSAVVVDVQRTARTSSESKAKDIFSRYETTVSQSGDSVTVKIDHEGDGWFHFNFGDEIRIKTTVTVPHDFNLDLETSGGDVVVTNVHGIVDTHTSGGDLNFKGIDGTLTGDTSGGDITLTQGSGQATLHTSGGDIEINGARGPIDARTSGGDISVRAVDGTLTAKTSGGSVTLQDVSGAVDARTSGGDVVARYSVAPRADVTLATTGGAVKLFVPSSAGFELDASTSGGEVESELPITIHGKRDRESLAGRVNSGGPHIYMRSSAGDIAILKMH
jgi:DUF4097 and DUF4098 domain-containing protein YvlB